MPYSAKSSAWQPTIAAAPGFDERRVSTSVAARRGYGNRGGGKRAFEGGVGATLRRGVFPRQWALSPYGKLLYLTEFGSDVLAVFPVGSVFD